jgi:hypothetical protein
VTRLDVKYAVLKPAPTAAQAVGVHVCTAERSSSEGLVVGHRSSLMSDADVSGRGDGRTDRLPGCMRVG